MKTVINLLFVFICLVIGVNAQQNGVLAVANGQNYTVEDLDPATREEFVGLEKSLKVERTELLGDLIAQTLFKDEAKARKITVDKLLDLEIPKRIPNPTAAEIQAVYDANKQSIGDKTLAELRPNIVDFLRRQAYPAAVGKFVSALKLKHKIVIGKDVNSAKLLPTDVLATVNSKPITVQFYDEKAGQSLYDLQADVYEKTYNYLETIIFNALITLDAKKENLSPSDLIAREVTSKMRDYSDEERETLENNFRQNLVQKYSVKILLTEPTPFVHKISVDDDPSRGSATAPVTVVMFTDFQCPACSATHPVLQKVLAKYGDKIRFVVRDYPLTQNHKNAFKAAEAANAANMQGKFFEYIELLYNNQESLDIPNLKKFAAEIGLNMTKFNADLDSGKFAEEIKKDMADGDEYGIGSTPTIFVNGIKVRSLSADSFKKAIERALK